MSNVKVYVYEVNIPAGSSVGFGKGYEENTHAEVSFVGDHGPMLELSRAVNYAREIEGELPIAEVPSYMITRSV